MVIFDRQNAFVQAVECAFSMNSVSQYVIIKHFTRGEVTCGIGIDAGKMLATKTGVSRRGFEQANYRNLVWLGRPANVASKLTVLANKAEDSFNYAVVNAAFYPTLLGLGAWQWREIYANDFVRQLSSQPGSNHIIHSDPSFASMFWQDRTYIRRPKTDPILMTEAVWKGYKAAAPLAKAVLNGWFKEIMLTVPSYSGKVYSGDVHYPVFKS
jgi:adenylate cyclase